MPSKLKVSFEWGGGANFNLLLVPIAHDDHKNMLEHDNRRKISWARERARRVEEKNRRAATTVAEAARRRAERAREHETVDAEAVRTTEKIRRQAWEEAIRIA